MKDAKGGKMEKIPEGIQSILHFEIDTYEILEHYLKEMSLFEKKIAESIVDRYHKDKKTISEEFSDRRVLTNISLSLEYHSTGFRKLILFTRWIYKNIGLDYIINEEQTKYIYHETPNARWQRLWEFKLKDFLSRDEYYKIVGKKFQQIDGVEAEDQDSSLTYGEELTLRLDCVTNEVILYGNYGRFNYTGKEYYKDCRIPEENVIFRFHPGVKKYENKPNDDYSGGSWYRPSREYREWHFLPLVFMSFFSVDGIEEKEDHIKPKLPLE